MSLCWPSSEVEQGRWNSRFTGEAAWGGGVRSKGQILPPLPVPISGPRSPTLGCLDLPLLCVQTCASHQQAGLLLRRVGLCCLMLIWVYVQNSLADLSQLQRLHGDGARGRTNSNTSPLFLLSFLQMSSLSLSISPPPPCQEFPVLILFRIQASEGVNCPQVCPFLPNVELPAGILSQQPPVKDCFFLEDFFPPQSVPRATIQLIPVAAELGKEASLLFLLASCIRLQRTLWLGGRY